MMMEEERKRSQNNVDKSYDSSEFQQRGQQREPVERQYPFAERVVQS